MSDNNKELHDDLMKEEMNLDNDWDNYYKFLEEENLEALKAYWGLKENILLGKFRRLKKDGTILFKPFNLNKEEIIFPFHRGILDRIYSRENEKPINILNDPGSFVVFRFEINGKKDSDEYPIKIVDGSLDFLDAQNDIKKHITKRGQNKISEEEIEGLEIELEELKREKEEVSLDIKSLEDRKDRLSRIGFPVWDTDSQANEVEDIEDHVKLDKKEHINHIRNYLKDKRKLFYNKEIIESFYNALGTNQIILLSGPPGTGKTSLVEGFSQAIGANYKIISVKPNWTDNDDLLGFFNPIEGQEEYISTPFLDVLSQARMEELNKADGEEELYIICLDEMNLAHIEYYFSEFITKLELDEPFLELYSENIYNNLKREVSVFMERFRENLGEDPSEDEVLNWLNENNIEKKEYDRYMRLLDNLERYPAQFKMPRNVKFVGTLNMDETTKDLSSKILDRSFTIEIGYQEEEEVDSSSDLKPLYLKGNDIEIKNSNSYVYMDVKDELEYLNKEYISGLGVRISFRGFNSAAEYTNSSVKAGIDSRGKIVDAIVVSKVLPKLNFYKDSEENKKYISFKRFKSYIKDNKEKYPLTLSKLERMHSLCKETNIVNFWE